MAIQVKISNYTTTAVRTSIINPVGSFLGISTHERLAESFHTSGAAALHPPSNSAHISAHNSVKGTIDPSTPAGPSRLAQFERRIVAMQQKRINAAYDKAQRRATKRGRTIPPREQYYDHWGYPYVYYGPYMYPMWWTPGMYYGAYPGYVAVCAAGATGSCAAGTCGYVLFSTIICTLVWSVVMTDHGSLPILALMSCLATPLVHVCSWSTSQTNYASPR